MEPLVDGWGREIKSLRVSVTDKCNFRCTLLHAGRGPRVAAARRGADASRRSTRLVRVLAAMGVEEVRLTGGEPLVRRDLPDARRDAGARARRRRPVADDERRPARPARRAARRRRAAPPQRLARLALAHPLRRDHAPRRARPRPRRARGGRALPGAAPDQGQLRRDPGLHRDRGARPSPSSRGASRTSSASSSSCRSTPTSAWRDDEVLTGAEIRAIIEERWPLEEIPAKASSTARRFRFADGAGEIGFVNPVSEPFCSSCDRIRLTADGQLRTCLFSRREWDLKTPLRDGATDAELERRAALGRRAQGAQAPHQRARLRPREPLDEPDRRLTLRRKNPAERARLQSPWPCRRSQQRPPVPPARLLGFCPPARDLVRLPAVYQIARGFADRDPAKAFANGLRVIDFEQSANGLYELTLQRLVDQSHAARDDRLLDVLELRVHRRRARAALGLPAPARAFLRFRNTILVANVIGLIGYMMLPTAPPRMFPDFGFARASAHHGTGSSSSPRTRTPPCRACTPPTR